MDGMDIQRVDETFFRRPPVPLTFPFAGPVPGPGMDQRGADRAADQGKLFIGVWRPIVHQEFIRL